MTGPAVEHLTDHIRIAAGSSELSDMGAAAVGRPRHPKAPERRILSGRWRPAEYRAWR